MPATGRPILIAILALAAGLRVAGLGVGLCPSRAGPVLHPLARPDEQYLWNLGLGIYAGDPNPHFFLHPTLLPTALALADAAYVAAASLALGSRDAVERELLRDPRALVWIDRGLVAAIGVGTVLLVHRLAGRAFGPAAGLAAALFLAVAPLHVRDSHFGVTDVPLAAFVCLALLAALRVESRGSARDYALAGIAVGLAASTKYSGALLLAPVVAADLVGRTAGPARPRHRLALALALAPAAFLAGTPFAALAWPEFRDGVAAQLVAQSGPDWLGVDLGPGWSHHLRFTLWHGLGSPLLAASLAGAAPAARPAPRARAARVRRALLPRRRARPARLRALHGAAGPRALRDRRARDRLGRGAPPARAARRGRRALGPRRGSGARRLDRAGPRARARRQPRPRGRLAARSRRPGGAGAAGRSGLRRPAAPLARS